MPDVNKGEMSSPLLSAWMATAIMGYPLGRDEHMVSQITARHGVFSGRTNSRRYLAIHPLFPVALVTLPSLRLHLPSDGGLVFGSRLGEQYSMVTDSQRYGFTSPELS